MHNTLEQNAWRAHWSIAIRKKTIQIFSKVGNDFGDTSFEACNSNTSTSSYAMVNDCQSVASLKKGSQELETKNRLVWYWILCFCKWKLMLFLSEAMFGKHP